MFLIINKKTEEIKMVSEKKPKVDETIFNIVEETSENYEDYKFGTGYSMKYKNNKIEKTKIISNKEDLKNKIEKAKTINELKDIIINNLL